MLYPIRIRENNLSIYFISPHSYIDNQNIEFIKPISKLKSYLYFLFIFLIFLIAIILYNLKTVYKTWLKYFLTIYTCLLKKTRYHKITNKMCGILN